MTLVFGTGQLHEDKILPHDLMMIISISLWCSLYGNSKRSSAGEASVEERNFYEKKKIKILIQKYNK